MKNPISALMSPCLNVTARRTSLAMLPALLLAGCGSSKGTQDGGSTTAADTAEQQEGTETAASDSGEKIVIRVVGPMENENDTTNPVTKQ